MTRLTAATAALRAAGGEASDDLADATRRRLVRSLERRVKAHRQLASAVTILVTLVIGGAVSWALSTGRLRFLSSQRAVPVTPTPTAADRPTDPHGNANRGAALIAVTPSAPPDRRTGANAGAVPSHAPEPWSPAPPVIAPPVVAAPRPSRPPVVAVPPPVVAAPRPAHASPPSSPVTGAPAGAASRPAPRPSPVVAAPSSTPAPVVVATDAADLREAPFEALYRKAHELHFHGTDYAAALVAWDAYLAAEPMGRFAVEAQFNRALALIRLARYGEARTALEPFARGEIAPAGYRRDEAEQLILRIARLNER